MEIFFKIKKRDCKMYIDCISGNLWEKVYRHTQRYTDYVINTRLSLALARKEKCYARHSETRGQNRACG